MSEKKRIPQVGDWIRLKHWHALIDGKYLELWHEVTSVGDEILTARQMVSRSGGRSVSHDSIGSTYTIKPTDGSDWIFKDAVDPVLSDSPTFSLSKDEFELLISYLDESDDQELTDLMDKMLKQAYAS